MNSKVYRVLMGLLSLSIIGGFILIAISRSQGTTAKIIATNFAGYDFARAVTGGSDEVELLIAPGSDLHHFEPTPEDIIKIKNSELFIYNGGESESWVDEILENNSVPSSKTLRMMDMVSLLYEQSSAGESSEETEEYDEHIWTSPLNAVKTIEAIKEKLTKLHPEKSDFYAKNTDSYTSRLESIHKNIKALVDNKKATLIFADRFPFLYFAHEYGLNYISAFPGCSEQTEASPQTIARLIDAVKNNDSKVIFKIELTSDKLAQTIAGETGARVLELNSAHNIAKSDFDRGQTYAEIMERNYDVLKELFK